MNKLEIIKDLESFYYSLMNMADIVSEILLAEDEDEDELIDEEADVKKTKKPKTLDKSKKAKKAPKKVEVKKRGRGRPRKAI